MCSRGDVPPRLWCASCLDDEDVDALELRAPSGRWVWLCPVCMTETGRLEQFRDWVPGGMLQFMNQPFGRRSGRHSK